MEDNGWRTYLLSSMTKCWQENDFTDLVIITEDGEIRAHKVVLAAASPYFRALLSTDLLEKMTSVIKLSTISSTVLETILLYIYSGSTALSEDNVESILALADYFQISALKLYCCKFIKMHMDVDNCLPYYELAILHRCYDLAYFAFQKAMVWCSKVVTSASFLMLQFTTVQKLLKQPILGITHEDEIFQGIMKWISVPCYAAERRHQMWPLLCLISFRQMTPIMKRSFFDKLDEIESNRSALELRKFVTNEDFAPVRYNNELQLLMMFGGESSGRISGSVECFTLGCSSWRHSIPQHDKADYPNLHLEEGAHVIPRMRVARVHAGIVRIKNLVYIIGGQNNETFYRICETYDLQLNEWGSIASVPLEVHGCGAAAINDHIYVAGGKSYNKYENGLLVYSEEANSWTKKCSMSTTRSNFGLCSFNGFLFAIGGICASGRNCVQNSCEKYDHETDTWSSIASLCQKRSHLGVAAVDDYIYAIGGYDGFKWLSSVERYDPFKDQWIPVSDMLGARSSFGICVSQNRIYCMGGYNGNSTTNSAEKYNPRTDLWHCVPSLQTRRFGAMAATLTLPKDRLKPG